VPTRREAEQRTLLRGLENYLLLLRVESRGRHGAGTVTVLAFTVAEADPPAEPANILPSAAAPVLSVMLTAASTFPLKMLVVSIVRLWRRRPG
jgi:hypothetical protein